jgi:NADH-quinone oxidoreductase subunit C
MQQIFKKIIDKLSKYSARDFIIAEYNTVFLSCDIKDVKEIINTIKQDPEIKSNLLTDMTAVDYPENEKRFKLIYNLLSLEQNIRIIIQADVDDGMEVESITDIFNAACWYEREIWDMFGISFNQNPDLRRILTDYGFEGHPLRKDFPLTGHKEVRYDAEKMQVIYEPVQLPQEYRTFNFLSPWEGPNYILPGDEKATEQDKK